MSGGSYNYLCYVQDLEDLVEKRHSLKEMADRLVGMDEADFPGVTAAAQETLGLLHLLRIWDTHASVRIDMLTDVWKAVEWWDSADYGSDQVAEAIKDFVTPKI